MSEHQPPQPMPRQDLSAFAVPRGVPVSKLAPRRRPTAPAEADSTPAEDNAASGLTSAPGAANSSASVPAAVDGGEGPSQADPIEEPAAPTSRPASGKTSAPGRPAPPTRVPRAPGGRQRGAEASGSSTTEPRLGSQIIVYLKDGVADRLRATAKQSGRTHLQLMVDALDATHGELPDLLEAAGYIDRRESSLFGNSMGGLRRRATGERKAQIGVRPPAGILAVIDKVVVDCAAPNRSALIEVALDKHLPIG